MNIWENTVITTKGHSLLAKLMAGNTLNITRAVAGAGYVTPGLLGQQTAVTDPKQELKFKAISYPEEGKCKLPCFLTNDGVSTAYVAKQVGVYAEDPDEGEILYFIAQAPSGKGTEVPSETEMPGYSAEWNFFVRYGQADAVSVTVDPSNTVSQKEMEQYVADTLKDEAFLRGGVYTGDMNELVFPGQYRVQSNENLPTDASYGQVFVGRSVVSGGNNDTVAQLVIGYQGKAAMYYRGGQLKEGTWTWTEWSSVYSNQKNPKFNSVAWLGLNPVKTADTDTVELWNSMGSGFAQYSGLDQLNDQPSRYGFVISYTYGSDVFQMWFTLPSGALYSRSGNATGWSKSWTKIYDELNPPTPNELGVVSLSGGTYIPDNSNLNNYKTPGNYHCSGDANASTLSNCPTTHAFRLRIGYATGNTSYIYQELIDWVTGTRYYRQTLASSDSWSNWDKTYDTTNLKFSTLAFLGQNPISSTADDTPVKWQALGSGYAWYTGAGLLTDQPNQYGFLISYTYGSDIFQIWKCQSTGAMYIRSGNSSGWGHTWAKVFDSLNKPTPEDIGALPITGGEITGSNLYIGNGHGRILANDSLFQVESWNKKGDDANRRILSLSNSSTESDKSRALILTDRVGTVNTAYKIYGEHNKPSAADITAGTLGGRVRANATNTANVGDSQVRNINAGTTDLVAGSDPLETGAVYFVYE